MRERNLPSPQSRSAAQLLSPAKLGVSVPAGAVTHLRPAATGKAPLKFTVTDRATLPVGQSAHVPPEPQNRSVVVVLTVPSALTVAHLMPITLLPPDAIPTTACPLGHIRSVWALPPLLPTYDSQFVKFRVAAPAGFGLNIAPAKLSANTKEAMTNRLTQEPNLIAINSPETPIRARIEG